MPWRIHLSATVEVIKEKIGPFPVNRLQQFQCRLLSLQVSASLCTPKETAEAKVLLKIKCKTQWPGTRERVLEIISLRWELSSKVNQTLRGLESSKGLRKDRTTRQPVSYLVLILFVFKYKEIFPGKWYKFSVIIWNKRRQKFSIRKNNLTSRCWRMWYLWWQPREECLVCSKSEALPQTLSGSSLCWCLLRKIFKQQKGKASTLHWNHLCSQTRIQPRATNKKRGLNPLLSLERCSATDMGPVAPGSDSGWPRCFILKGLYRCTFCCPAAARCTPWTSEKHKEQLWAKKCEDKFSCLILRRFFLALNRRGTDPGGVWFLCPLGEAFPAGKVSSICEHDALRL